MKGESPYDYHRRKADEHWEVAGLARQDGDQEDCSRHTKLAKKHDQKAKECSQ